MSDRKGDDRLWQEEMSGDGKDEAIKLVDSCLLLR